MSNVVDVMQSIISNKRDNRSEPHILEPSSVKGNGSTFGFGARGQLEHLDTSPEL